MLGDACVEDEVDEDAERHYREAVAAYERIPNVRGHAAVRLAELIARTRQREKYDEAEALLQSYEPFFKIDHFRVCAARARIAADRGRKDEAASYARAALDLESDAELHFPRHPDVGHVKADVRTLEQLRALAGGPGD
jgi:tetratricopeptide (TPR) repeat protein